MRSRGLKEAHKRKKDHALSRKVTEVVKFPHQAYSIPLLFTAIETNATAITKGDESVASMKR